MKLELFKNCITAHVYRWNLGDCTNGGISSKANTVIIPLIPTDEIDPSNLENGALDGVPVLEIVRRNIGGEYINFKSFGIKRHTMMGGNFAYSCDARFSAISKYPIPIHDRIE